MYICVSPANETTKALKTIFIFQCAPFDHIHFLHKLLKLEIHLYTHPIKCKDLTTYVNAYMLLHKHTWTKTKNLIIKILVSAG